jgi:hypothetical protein
MAQAGAERTLHLRLQAGLAPASPVTPAWGCQAPATADVLDTPHTKVHGAINDLQHLF